MLSGRSGDLPLELPPKARRDCQVLRLALLFLTEAPAAAGTDRTELEAQLGDRGQVAPPGRDRPAAGTPSPSRPSSSSGSPPIGPRRASARADRPQPRAPPGLSKANGQVGPCWRTSAAPIVPEITSPAHPRHRFETDRGPGLLPSCSKVEPAGRSSNRLKKQAVLPFVAVVAVLAPILFFPLCLLSPFYNYLPHFSWDEKIGYQDRNFRPTLQHRSNSAGFHHPQNDNKNAQLGNKSGRKNKRTAGFLQLFLVFSLDKWANNMLLFN